jgi:hypothetical protein
MIEVIKKLRFKGDGIVINAPAPLEKEFVKLGFSTSLVKNVKSANTLVFVNNKNEFLDFLNNHLQNILPDSIFWIAYPKGTSIIKTDINRDILRVTSEGYGISTVAVISIDDTWSALRFKPLDKVGK